MRLIIVSNRAPVRLSRTREGTWSYDASTGGLATGLSAFVENERSKGTAPEILWIGWPGTEIPEQEHAEVEQRLLQDFGVKPVFLNEDVVDRYYHGFCNKTIWPLFHYFPSYAVYDRTYWEEYVRVNEQFAKAIADVARKDDVIWIHDYQLMLAPAMLRRRMPEAKIGFFLHIPFPSYEILRLLPSDWRRPLLEGVLGADLVGFHTNDYRSYFVRSIQRIVGVDDGAPDIMYQNRRVRLDVFPMGIDYDRFSSAIDTDAAQQESAMLQSSIGAARLVLSIDRQDYSKGILNRLEGFAHFLETYPEWRGKVTTVLVVVPSRDRVEHYQAIKSHIDELVGNINGRFGTLEWTPIVYQYRSLEFHELAALYHTSDVALVTPLRDGMNLIAKEYVASRRDRTGVLILSEMAGAVDELDESIVINPNIKEEISAAILEALEMPISEQQRRMALMQQRIATYDVVTWAKSFLTSLDAVKIEQRRLAAKLLTSGTRKGLVDAYRRSTRRLLFLDYDGTLTPIVRNPTDARPTAKLLSTLKTLGEDPNTQIVILSGRDKDTMEQWFSDLPIDMSAEHGLFLRYNSDPWRVLKPVRSSWKRRVRPTLQKFVERLPGAFIEEKDYALAFHYRKSDSELAQVRVKELIEHLRELTSRLDVQILQGKKVIEIRTAGVDKGIAALKWLATGASTESFVLSIGDDTTDEDLFRVMPEEAYSIKVGLQPSHARFNLRDPSEVLELLEELAET